MEIQQFIRSIEQPQGGFINPKEMMMTKIPGEAIDLKKINIETSLFHHSVQKMIYYLTTKDKEKSFHYVLEQYIDTPQYGRCIDYYENIREVANGILSVETIINMVRLLNLDQTRMQYKGMDIEVTLSEETTEAFQTINLRWLDFQRTYGFFDRTGLSLGGSLIDFQNETSDYLSKDTLLLISTANGYPSKFQTVKLFVEYLLGIHSYVYKSFVGIRNIAVYNPRLNEYYRIPLKKLPEETYLLLQKELGYEDDLIYPKEELMDIDLYSFRRRGVAPVKKDIELEVNSKGKKHKRRKKQNNIYKGKHFRFPIRTLEFFFFVFLILALAYCVLPESILDQYGFHVLDPLLAGLRNTLQPFFQGA